MKKGYSVNQIIFKLTSILPLTWMASLYTFAALCTYRLGHLPIPSLNDPKYLGFDTLYAFVFWCGLASIYSLGIWFLSFLLSWYYFKQKSPTYLSIFLLGFGLMLVQFIVDPFGIIEWYMD